MKEQWLIDLLVLCKYHNHFNKDVLMETFGILEDLAIKFMVECALSESDGN